MIEEIRFRDFPWNKIPWALDENRSRYIPGHIEMDASVLLLRIERKIVAYAVYDVRRNSGYVEVHYIHTCYPGRGYASQLMNDICMKFGSEHEMQAFSTSSTADGLLRKFGFEQPKSEKPKWVRRKDGKRT